LHIKEIGTIEEQGYVHTSPSSPAETIVAILCWHTDYTIALDLNQHLIKHSTATFFVRVAGKSMRDVGIHSGNVLIVDRALPPSDGSVVIAVVNGELTVKRLAKRHGQLMLVPENSQSPPLPITETTAFEVWGVVTYVIHNDGCVIARSDEAKALGIPMGLPAFKLADLVKKHSIEVYSSNYTLYGDLSARVMTTLMQWTPDVEVYSIDEAFLQFSPLPPDALTAYGQTIRTTIQQWTGIPVSIGIGPTKTLAKLANRLAKRSPEVQGVVALTSPAQIEATLTQTSIEDIWGIGPGYTRRLKVHDITTVLQLRDVNDRWIRQELSGLLDYGWSGSCEEFRAYR
jgi:hypothetical protein